MAPKLNVLLLTNRDSDNVGDQIIEATVISLLEAAFENLGMPANSVEISSRAAGIISKAYMKTKNPELLKPARAAISEADAVVFGGAPLFNYTYQNFYLRTITTLKLAEEYGVPVLFSSIGVEPFNPENRKSVALKKALALSCVRQITTRDDYESLAQYVKGTDTPIAHVSDPAVFADVVFGDGRKGESTRGGGAQQKIGLVVTRSEIFKDNGIDFPEAEQLKFWLDVVALLTERGYDYKLFTTGHFTDENFLKTLVAAGNIPAKQAALVVNSPEELINELSACDGVVAYRLHASITSFAYGIPSIGLSWNFKVPYFYESVGHGNRALSHERWTAPEVVTALEKAIAEGVVKDEAFLWSVYETLFYGLKGIFAPSSDHEPYSYRELREKMPQYKGTSRAAYREKIGNKSRRAESYYARKGLPSQTAKPSLVSRGYDKLARKIKNAR